MMGNILASLSNKVKYERPILIIFTGESNSGGQALNTSANFDELLPRYKVRHLNNMSLKFENLHIGVNNNIGHAGGIDSIINHGWELQLAARCEAGDLPSLPIFTCKTGQGGSVISQWDTGQSYYTTFLSRTGAAMSMLKNPRIFIWYSQGINDVIAGTNLSIWKSLTKAHINQIRIDLGTVVPVIIPYFNESAYPDIIPINNTFDEIATEMTDIYMVSSSGATMSDSYHWNYAGMKVVSNNLIDKTLELL